MSPPGQESGPKERRCHGQTDSFLHCRNNRHSLLLSRELRFRPM